ncbi:MAG: FAD-dependent oxidoreductase, partial [Chlamydiales bacterium]
MEIRKEKIHEEKVHDLIALLHADSRPITFVSQTSHTLRQGAYKGDTLQLDLANFNEIVQISVKEGWVAVEPRMKLRSLIKKLLSYGYIPAVVPEFTDITVGGAIMGTALESSSFRYGQFNDTCLEYELVLGDGKKVTASPEENNDLFYGISGSFGTLAILTLAKIRIIKAKKNVEVVLHKNRPLFPLPDCDFLDGIQLSKYETIIIEGRMTDAPVTYRQNRYWSRWFYAHLMQTCKKQFVMPLEEYLFRFDRGAF